MAGQAWSPDELRTVGELLAFGLSLNAIGVQLHLTKQAVSGRVYRNAHLHQLLADHGTSFAVVPHQQPPTLPWRDEPGGVVLVELTLASCHWPKSERLFCGEPVLPGSTYCPRHHRRAHQ